MLKLETFMSLNEFKAIIKNKMMEAFDTYKMGK